MQTDNRSKVLTALLKALRPLAHILIRAGIDFKEFAELAKRSYVGVATDYYGIRGRPTNISRTSALVGLTRKEVARIRYLPEEVDSTMMTNMYLVAESLNQWYADTEFLDGNGYPLPLNFDGPGVTFSSLIKKYGGEVRPGAALVALKGARAVDETEDGQLVTVSRFLRHVEFDIQLEQTLTYSVTSLLTTMNHNLQFGEDAPRIERAVYSINIRKEDLAKIRNICRDKGNDFAHTINEILTAYESHDEEVTDETDITMIGMGIYFFERTADRQ